MPASDYWDSQDLKAVAADGLVNEDVMQQIFDISRIPLPFMDNVGEDSHDNDYFSWTQDSLDAPNVNNEVVSGADGGARSDTNGKRVGNYSQISAKYVKVTERARNTDNIGRADELGYNLMMQQQNLYRDMEAIAIQNRASRADDNNTTAGRTAGFDTWIESNIDAAEVGASVGGFNTATKIVDAHTDATTAVAGTEARLSALIETTYGNNGNPSIAMSTPAVIKRLAQRLFASSRVATPTANVSGENPTQQASQGFINVMTTDFGFTLELVPNRLQQDYNSDTAASLLGIDPSMAAISYLHKPKAEELAKQGLSHSWQITSDWGVKVYEEKAHFNYRDIDEDAAWTA